MTTLASRDSKFIDSANRMIAVAEGKYGVGSPEVAAVQKAWDLVGVSVETTPVETEPEPESEFRLSVGDDFLVHLYQGWT